MPTTARIPWLLFRSEPSQPSRLQINHDRGGFRIDAGDPERYSAQVNWDCGRNALITSFFRKSRQNRTFTVPLETLMLYELKA